MHLLWAARREAWRRDSPDYIYSVSISPDGSVAAFGGQHRTVVVVSGKTGETLREIGVSDTIHSLHLMSSPGGDAGGPWASARGDMLLVMGGDQKLLTVCNARSGSEVLCLPMEDAVRSVYATHHSVLVGTGRRALMFGKGNTHFGWHDHPSFTVAAALLSHKEHAVRCVRPMVSVHPGIINSRDQARARRALARTGGPRRTPRAL